jgi:hypothetical protein
VEAVGPNATLDGSFIVFRLPDLQPGIYPLSIRARGDTSINSPDLIIVACVGNLFPVPWITRISYRSALIGL